MPEPRNNPEFEDRGIWANNYVQFTRLIAEIAAVDMEPEAVEELCQNMDITQDQLNELVDRALREWEHLKEVLVPLGRDSTLLGERPFTLHVLFGKAGYAAYDELISAVRACECPSEIESLIKEYEDSMATLVTETFATEGERLAYIEGMADMDGWMEYNILTDLEVRELNEVLDR